MLVASTLAHYDTAKITAVKSFIIQALFEKSFLLKCDKNETNAFSQGMSWNTRLRAEITHGIIEIVVHLCVYGIDIESLLNRLLKVCYVPATSTGPNRLLFCCSC